MKYYSGGDIFTQFMLVTYSHVFNKNIFEKLKYQIGLGDKYLDSSHTLKHELKTIQLLKFI